MISDQGILQHTIVHHGKWCPLLLCPVAKDPAQVVLSVAPVPACFHMLPRTDILVCQAGSCRRAGSEAVLVEIEELTKGIQNCRVNAANCLGACDSAPSTLVWRGGRERLFTKINETEKSVRIVEAATGVKLNLDDPEMLQRMAVARQTRVRQQACLESKWNLALAGMREQVSNACQKRRLKLQLEFGELLHKAGLWEESLEQLAQVQKAAPSNLEVIMG